MELRCGICLRKVQVNVESPGIRHENHGDHSFSYAGSPEPPKEEG